MQALTFVSLFGAVLAFFFALRLSIQATENRPAALAFAGFLLCAMIFLLDEAGIRERFFIVHPGLFGLGEPFIMAIGPWFFLYACATTQPAFVWRARHLLHFIGPLFLVSIVALMVIVPEAEKARFAEEAYAQVMQGGPLSAPDQVVLAFFDAYQLVYFGAAWWRLWKWRERVAEEQDEGRSHPLRGIGLFATLVLAIGVISAVLDFSPWAGRGGTITALACVIALFALLWLVTQPRPFLVAAEIPPADVPARPQSPPSANALTHSPFVEAPASATLTLELSGPPFLEPSIPAPAPTQSTPQTSSTGDSLKPDELAILVARVRGALDEDRVFLDPDLSLIALAERARTTRHRLSAALRQGFGATFHQLISRYRVTEAARVLETPDGRLRTIADIAFASGFNTLSAFNAAFRAHFGLTPSTYRDRNRDGPAGR